MFYYKVAILARNLATLTYSSKEKLEAYSLVELELQKKQVQGIILEELEKPSFKTLEIIKVLPEKFTTYQILLANFISYYYISSLARAFSLLVKASKEEKVEVKEDFPKIPELNEIQNQASSFISSSLQTLLFGDTGSGKSEVYISFIIKTLKEGKQVLFLMPEISLTPQMTKRLQVYFANNFGLWHSKISKKSKEETLKKLLSGEIKFIVGARSALFLPFENLGLIIVDEEHDDSYKNQASPFYNAKDLAIFLSKKLNIKLILGSATPLLTTYFKIPHFRMKGSYFEASKEVFYDESESELSPKIVQALKENLDKKEQSIIFLPRRANYRFVLCEKCKNFIKCPHCSIALSLHSDKNSLVCHYCSYTKYAKSKCDFCGSFGQITKKIGTDEVVKQLQDIFPQARISKFDSDSMTSQKKLQALLSAFNDEKIDILVGTQMLSKGHDYHKVTLAIILGIDEYLSYSDFRAREKTLALAIQVSGRAGRAGKAKVIIQSFFKDFFSFYLDDYEAFIKDELPFREELYPPYKRLLRILISSSKPELAEEKMQNIQNFAKSFPDLELIAYGKAQLKRIANKYRFEILLRADSPKTLINFASSLDDKTLQIDIDPLNFS